MIKNLSYVSVLTGIYLILVLFPGQGIASLEAHVHGEAELYLILDEAELHVEFNSPAINLVGFEHKNLSKEEKEKLTSVKSQLKGFDQWLEINGGDCELKESKSGSSYDTHTGHHHNDENHKDHEDQEDHGHHDDHSGHDHDEQGHQSVDANLLFICQNPENIEQLTVSIKKLFPGVEKINIQWIFNDKQGATIGDRPVVEIDISQ